MQSTGFWAVLRATLSSFWVCRISILSVLAGWLLFYGAPQAQSVFFDLHTHSVGVWHWAAFYLAVFLFWMLPTQLSTRVMLHAGEDRLQDAHTTWYAILIVHLPWVLALLCLASVAAGQYWAFDHIPDEGDLQRRSLEAVAYSQLRALLSTTIVLIVLWLLAWIVLPRIINRLTVRSGLLDIWLFRVIATVLFGRRATTRTHRDDAAPPEGDQRVKFSPEQLQTAWAAIMLFIIWLASLYLVFLSPLEIQPALSRAPMFPILVGAWIPVLTFFVYGAHRFRLPILAAFILLMTFVANTLTGLHDVRLVAQNAQTGPLEARQPTLEEALAWWRKANGCSPILRSPCSVRPIIVAAEGGASRAGFFTGSLLAHLEDISESPFGNNAPGATGALIFSRQLFAVSAVSGSSLGAAVFAALREDSQGEAWPRPEPEQANNALWFKSGKAFGVGGMKPEPLPVAGTRKDIVQQILAGDFLTPVMAAFSLDVWVPWHAKFYSRGDRTYFLEQSWERRFADPSGRSRRAKSGFDRGLSKLSPEENRWRPILVFNGTSITTGRRIITSNLYPRIVSPDDPKDTPLEQRTIESIFRDSYDTYDLMCVPSAAQSTGACTCVQADPGHLQPLRIRGCDVSLSTAVSNSARFPVISSHGDISTGSKLVDRISDGGYFDYSGIVSALELQVQIARLDHQMNPFVLFLTNDPGFNPQACQQAPDAKPIDELDVLRRPAVPPSTPIPAKLFSILAYPLDTLFSTRIGRGEQTMAQAVLLNRYENVRKEFHTAPKELARLREGFQAYLNFDIVSVGARCNKEKQVRPVPMNWWLAMPTQAYLDEEICADHNQGTLAGVLSQLGEQPGRGEEAAHAARYRKEAQRVAEICALRGDPVRARSRQTR